MADGIEDERQDEAEEATDAGAVEPPRELDEVFRLRGAAPGEERKRLGEVVSSFFETTVIHTKKRGRPPVPQRVRKGKGKKGQG